MKYFLLAFLIFNASLWANDEEIIRYLDFLENYELLEDENYEDLLEQEVEDSDE